MKERKSHDPTPRRLKQARKRGQVLKSPALSAAAAITGCICGVILLAPFLFFKNKMLLDYILVQGTSTPSVLAEMILTTVCSGVIGILLPGVLFALLSEISQVGLIVEWKPLLPRLQRLNPVVGFLKLLSGLKNIYRPVLKVSALILVSYFCLRSMYRLLLLTTIKQNGQLLQVGREAALLTLSGGCLVLLIAGVLEYLQKRTDFFRELSMSADEVRREHKEMEGDPVVRSHRQALHREYAMQDLVRRVRRAKVIIVERA